MGLQHRRKSSRFIVLGIFVAWACLLPISSAVGQDSSKGKERPADQQNRSIQSMTKRSGEQQRVSEQEMTRQLLAGIKKLQSEGKLEAASRQAADAAARAPNPATKAASRITDVNNQLNASRQAQQDQERATMGAWGQVEKARTLPKGDIEFPKDWKARPPRRSSDDVAMTAKEVKLLRALNSTISLQLNNQRLQDVIEYIQDRTDQSIVLDKTAMDDAGVTYDTPVTVNLKGVTLRTALQKVFRDLGLTYVIKDEVIQVVTPAQASQIMRTQVYYVGDLVSNAFQAAALIDLIQSTVAPQSWVVNGGTGTIAYDPVRNALIIKQTAEFHPVLSNVLR